MRIYVIAGEASGDIIGGKIITHIKQLSPSAQINGIGGAQMLASGLELSLFEMVKINLFGFWEVLPHIFRLYFLIKKTVADIIQKQPDVIVTIDSPGFCFRVVKEVKKLAPHIKRVHVVAPSVWAYKPERAIKVAALYDVLLTLFDFEVPLFEKYGLKTYCIGHPIFEQNFDYDNDKINSFKKEHLLTENIIAITPGSRAQEIKLHLPIFLASICKANIDHPSCVIVNTNIELNKLIDQIAKQYRVRYVISDQKVVAFQSAKIVLAKIGTNILEIAAAKKAIIACYKMHYLSFVFLKRIIKIRHATLVNIIANKPIIPELIQDEFSADLVVIKLEELWQSDDLREKQIQQNLSVIRKIGFECSTLPSQQAAKIILDVCI